MTTAMTPTVGLDETTLTDAVLVAELHDLTEILKLQSGILEEHLAVLTGEDLGEMLKQGVH